MTLNSIERDFLKRLSFPPVFHHRLLDRLVREKYVTSLAVRSMPSTTMRSPILGEPPPLAGLTPSTRPRAGAASLAGALSSHRTDGIGGRTSRHSLRAN